MERDQASTGHRENAGGHDLVAKRVWGHWGNLPRKLTADCVTPSPANVTLRVFGDCRKGGDIWLSLQNELGEKAAFTPCGLRGQPLKPEQRRGFDTPFSFNNPCHWTSPGISLSPQSWDPTVPSGPWFPPSRLHVLLLSRSLPLFRAARLAGRSGCTSAHRPQAGGCQPWGCQPWRGLCWSIPLAESL